MTPQETPSPRPSKWYHGIGFVILMLLVLGPLAFPLLWKSPRFNFFWKIAVTFLITAATVYLVVVSWELYVYLFRELKKQGLI